MCLSSLFPKPPEIKPLPPVPSASDEEVKRREQQEAMRLRQSGGTAATVKTDLAPESIRGERRVLLGV
ncbi:MAG: hypothetical protein JNK47_12765 [Mesorhizobium sp.]|nr:hypothetical protein [Mesorhizobium sp.]MBL8578092.1 hypothetical protein [Mesorhizobium sp.]